MIYIGKNVERYPSRVEGLTDKHLYLAMPMNKGVPIILVPGTKFGGRVIADGVVWQFTSVFVDKKPLPVPMWIAELPFDLQKIQLRSFVRIQVGLTVSIDVINEEPDHPPIPATTKDISGGGMLLAIRQSLPTGTKVKASFKLPDFGNIQVAAEVVRSDSLSETGFYTVGVKFVEIPEREREKIIKFIFKKQCERRQKGL
jgi:c-di-GMP-binding flagellar brake protein YcgR